MDYQFEIDRERAKINILRAKEAHIAMEIEDSERMIALLEKRAGKNGGDALDKFLDAQLAEKSQPVEAIAPPSTPSITPPVELEGYEFPKIRSDSIWPYVIRFMESKPQWRVDEIIAMATENKLVKTESAIRSTMSALKSWDFLKNDMPGLFSLKPKSLAFLKSLKSNQYTLGGTAGAAQDETTSE